MSDNNSPEEDLNKLLTDYSAPVARSMLLQATAQALANAAHNATWKQQQANITLHTATSNSVALLQMMGVQITR